MAIRASMTVSLPPELEHFVNSRVASGRNRSPSEVIQEGLRLLEDHESVLDASAADLRAKIAIGVEQADRGELLDGEEVFRELEESMAPSGK